MPDHSIRSAREALADRVSALPESAVRWLAYSLIYQPGADITYLRFKVDAAEAWSAKLAADFPTIFGGAS